VSGGSATRVVPRSPWHPHRFEPRSRRPTWTSRGDLLARGGADGCSREKLAIRVCSTRSINGAAPACRAAHAPAQPIVRGSSASQRRPRMVARVVEKAGCLLSTGVVSGPPPHRIDARPYWMRGRRVDARIGRGWLCAGLSVGGARRSERPACICDSVLAGVINCPSTAGLFARPSAGVSPVVVPPKRMGERGLAWKDWVRRRGR